MSNQNTVTPGLAIFERLAPLAELVPPLPSSAIVERNDSCKSSEVIWFKTEEDTSTVTSVKVVQLMLSL